MAGLSRAALRLQKDERLVQLVRRGSDEAFEAIVARYRGPLLGYSSRLLGRERAEDVVQQVFLKGLAGLRKDERELQLKPWLYRIVHNECVNALHRQDHAHEQLDENLDGVPQPPDELDRSERLREVVVGIQNLPPRQRSAIVLRELEGRSYAEIAHQIGATTPIVRQLLHRARERLRNACALLLPLPWLRLWAAGPSQPSLDRGRIAELVAGAGAGAGLPKLGATVIATGVIAGSAAVGVPREEHRRDGLGARTAQVESGGAPSERGVSTEPAGIADTRVRSSVSEHRGAGRPTDAGGAADDPGKHADGPDRSERDAGDGRHRRERDGDSEPVEESRNSDEGSGSGDERSSAPEHTDSGGAEGGGESGESGGKSGESHGSEPPPPPEPDSSGQEDPAPPET
jgi:RNA polymerase sigma factor (sigma-70 family)